MCRPEVRALHAAARPAAVPGAVNPLFGVLLPEPRQLLAAGPSGHLNAPRDTALAADFLSALHFRRLRRGLGNQPAGRVAP